MGKGELALDFLIQFCREPTHHCQEGESPPLLLLTLIYGDWGSCPDSWPRTSPLLELMLVSSRVISVPRERKASLQGPWLRANRPQERTGLLPRQRP